MQKTIDEWLFWCWRDELPLVKPDIHGPDGIGAGWNKVGVWTVGGTNRYGVVHALDQRRAAHGMALALADHVRTLDAVALALPDDWMPCADFDMGALGPEGERLPARALAGATHLDCQGERRMKEPVSQLVARYALTGRAPDCDIFPPVRKPVVQWNGAPRWFVKRRVEIGEDAHGQPIIEEREMDGWNEKKRRPVTGAYQKFRLEPDPLPGLIARAEYEVLHAALAVLVDEWGQFAGAWPEHACTPSPLPLRPWEGAHAPARRVLVTV